MPGRQTSNPPAAPNPRKSAAHMRLQARAYARLRTSAASAAESADTLAAKEDVLIAIRKIIRATDLHSRQLTKTVGLTAPQLLVLQAIRDLGAVAISRLSTEVSLSQATVTTILDRLEKRGLIDRQRSDQDKRVVHALLTDAGRAVVESAPTPLQEAFSVRFGQLEAWEQSLILSALQRVAAMMGADEIDASPFLELGDLSRHDHD
ncbi:MAG: MarR family transcriptional regulator [Pseudomonadales bacterium]